MVGEAEPGAGPDRKRYTITEEGSTEVDLWLATPISPEPHFQTELFAKAEVFSCSVARQRTISTGNEPHTSLGCANSPT